MKFATTVTVISNLIRTSSPAVELRTLRGSIVNPQSTIVNEKGSAFAEPFSFDNFRGLLQSHLVNRDGALWILHINHVKAGIGAADVDLFQIVSSFCIHFF